MSEPHRILSPEACGCFDLGLSALRKRASEAVCRRFDPVDAEPLDDDGGADALPDRDEPARLHL